MYQTMRYNTIIQCDNFILFDKHQMTSLDVYTRAHSTDYALVYDIFSFKIIIAGLIVRKTKGEVNRKFVCFSHMIYL